MSVKKQPGISGVFVGNLYNMPKKMKFTGPVLVLDCDLRAELLLICQPNTDRCYLYPLEVFVSEAKRDLGRASDKTIERACEKWLWCDLERPESAKWIAALVAQGA